MNSFYVAIDCQSLLTELNNKIEKQWLYNKVPIREIISILLEEIAEDNSAILIAMLPIALNEKRYHSLIYFFDKITEQLEQLIINNVALDLDRNDLEFIRWIDQDSLILKITTDRVSNSL